MFVYRKFHCNGFIDALCRIPIIDPITSGHPRTFSQYFTVSSGCLTKLGVALSARNPPTQYTFYPFCTNVASKQWNALLHISDSVWCNTTFPLDVFFLTKIYFVLQTYTHTQICIYSPPKQSDSGAMKTAIQTN